MTKIDQSQVGHAFEPVTSTIEKGRLKLFAKAIGETDPKYTDETAARAAGYRSLPAPPTYPMAIDLDRDGDLPPEVELLGLNPARILHANQEFTYSGDICAGDTITARRAIAEIFEKKGGALQFVVCESSYENQNGEQVARSRCTLVHRAGSTDEQ